MGTLEILGSTLVGGVVSAFVPLMSAEVLIVSAATLGPAHLALPCALLVAAGQMVGKSVIYLVARGAIQAPWMVSAEKLRNASTRFGGDGRPIGLLLFLSASAGLPPFYLTSVAAGVLGVSFPYFVVLGFTGRLIRFASLAAFPQLAQGVLQ
jgi:membrane protein YqaA with SNARE-associated domain